MILVTGIARSGTSILAELLATDRRYRYIFEPREWDAPHRKLARKPPRFSGWMNGGLM
jgi:adenosyl cobinamide kinase/adenosyl cobinamide phosphate guanylyltransferase